MEKIPVIDLTPGKEPQFDFDWEKIAFFGICMGIILFLILIFKF